METYKINTEFIELYKLLKAANLVSSGGEGKMMIEEEMVTVDGQIELRKKCKIRPGQIVELEGNKVKVE